MNNDNKYVKLGFTIFCSLAAVILLYMGISNLAAVGGFLNVITSTLQPILIGLVLAYLVSPIQRKIENGLSDRRFKKNIARTISVFCTVLLMLLICFIFLGVFLPQVINTITELAVSLPGMLNAFVEDINLNEYLRYNSQIIKFTEEAVDRFNEWFYEWIHSGIFSTLNSVLVGGFVNLVFVFGVISVAMYFVYGISNCAVELSHVGDGLTDRLDTISKLSDSITKLSGNLNTLKDHYSYYLSSDLTTQLNNIDGLLKQAGDLITKYTSKDSQIYQAIVNINTQMGNLRDTINSVVMKPTYLTFMPDIDYGFLKVSLSNGENLSLAENISNSIDAIKNLILKPVDSIASNADSLLDFANDFLVDVDQQFQSMGL